MLTVNELFVFLEKLKSEGKGDAQILYEDGKAYGPLIVSGVFLDGYTSDGWIDDQDDELVPNSRGYFEKVVNVIVLKGEAEEFNIPGSPSMAAEFNHSDADNAAIMPEDSGEEADEDYEEDEDYEDEDL